MFGHNFCHDSVNKLKVDIQIAMEVLREERFYIAFIFSYLKLGYLSYDLWTPLRYQDSLGPST